MGVGNFYLDNAETVYIYIDEVYPDDEYDEFYYEDMVETLLGFLPASFSQVENEWHEKGRVIAENGFFKIVVTSWEHYFALSVVIIDNDDRYDWGINPLAAHQLPKVAKSLFDKVNTCYSLRIRCSAWTSGPYVSEAA